MTRFRKSQYLRDLRKADLPDVTQALESPCISCFMVLLAHSFGGKFATRIRGFVQKFAHSWQPIALIEDSEV
jgi:hypothetical protein